MAEAGTMRYATRGVYGSNAYELAPQRRYDPEPEPQQVPERAPERQAQAAPRPQTRYGISPMAIFGFAVAAALIVLVLLAYVRFTEVAYATTELEETLDTLKEEERRLLIAYEDAFDINEIEDYAINELGMTKPTDAQIQTVDITGEDKAVILTDGSGSKGTLGDFINFVKSLLEYF